MWKGKIIHSLLLHINFELIIRLESVFNDLPSSETMKRYATICDKGHLRPINSIRYADSDLSGTRYASPDLSGTQYPMGGGAIASYMTCSQILLTCDPEYFQGRIPFKFLQFLIISRWQGRKTVLTSLNLYTTSHPVRQTFLYVCAIGYRTEFW